MSSMSQGGARLECVEDGAGEVSFENASRVAAAFASGDAAGDAVACRGVVLAPV